MSGGPALSFGPYRLDAQNECLWRGRQAIRLSAKAYAVLRYLAEHPGRLVTKDELFQAAWPDVVVSDAALTICIGEIRKALGETAQGPRFIATMHRRGYRFVAPVGGARSGRRAPAARPPAVTPVREPLAALVGREGELGRLTTWLREVQDGGRRVVFVTGEAGIGKTTLVDRFLATAAGDAGARVAWGQCLAHHGAGEAYLPVLDALGRLCREPGHGQVQALMRQHAPMWLRQMPDLLDAGEAEALQRRLAGTTRERMLRELGDFLEALAADRPLVMVLGDLHWSDHATLDVIAWLARRRGPMRLLLVGTYRPVDLIVHDHPLRAVRRELDLQRQCVELPLDGLDESAVAAYLGARFPSSALPPGLAPILHRRTDGQPLFMIQAVDAWVQKGWLVEVDGLWTARDDLAGTAAEVPESARQMIQQQLEALSAEEQRLVEAASVAGVVFSTSAVAAGIPAGLESVEERCGELARRDQFLRASGVEEWPDGTIAGRYEFRHALHHQVVYEQLPAARRIDMHRRIGTRLEVAWGTQVDEHAALLAVHFDRGRDAARAVRYLRQAATNALGRYAYHEAIDHLARAHEVVVSQPPTPARARQELELHLALGPVLMVARGLAAPEVERAYTRARALCAEVGETVRLFPVLRGLCQFHRNRGALPVARELGEELHALARRIDDPSELLESHDLLGSTLFHLGDYAAALPHVEQGIALIDPAAQRTLASRYGVAPGVACLAAGANVLWCLGAPAQAARRSEEALALAREIEHPYSLVLARFFAALLHHRRREPAAVQGHAEALLAIATEYGFRLWIALGRCWQGWAAAVQTGGATGLGEVRDGMEAAVATGQALARSLGLFLLAEATGWAGRATEGLGVVDEALIAIEASQRGDLLGEAHRLRGHLLLSARGGGRPCVEAERCLQQALALARRQGARSWELRAAISLAQLWREDERRGEGRALLAHAHGAFTEGCDTVDLETARALLDELA